MRLGFILSIGLWLLIIGSFSGCSGVKIWGELGAGRVDRMSSTQDTFRKPVPWKCYFQDCGAELEEMPK